MRLTRPAIPIEVRCRVVLRQLGELFIDQVIDEHRCDYTVAPSYRRTHGKLFNEKIAKLAELLGCEVRDLRLDHNPALALRMRRTKTVMVNGRLKTLHDYSPDANDPEHLIYRTRQDHHIKTYVRGDGAQFSDTTLMKRERKRQKKKLRRRLIDGKPGKPSAKIPARKNPWPPKGSRRWK